MLLISDLHLGVNRQAGTTIQSREALRSWMFQSFKNLLPDHDAVVINGDLFDEFSVSNRDLLETHTILADWLTATKLRLHLVAGNHDNSPKAEAVSSFSLLGDLLRSSFPEQVSVLDINEQGWVSGVAYAVAHHANQDLFDAALRKAYGEVDKGMEVLLLHANLDNGFAAESDHSLNVCEEAANQFTSRGVTVIFGHEHQQKRVGERIWIVGNQLPSSISDCLGNDDKIALRISPQGTCTSTVTWSRDQDVGGFVERDWHDLGPDSQLGNADFIRVTGEVPAAEAADCISRIAQLRREHPAFVITNATRVEGAVEVADLPSTFQAASRFDVMAFIKENLTAEEFSLVEKLSAEP